MPPDFLNSREDAILVISVLVLAYAVYKDPRQIGISFLDVLHAVLRWKLVLLFGLATLYTLLIIYGAKQSGLWHTEALKPTIYWFAGTAVVLIGEAVSRAAPKDPEFTRRVLRRVIGVTIVVEFVVNVSALPLGFELLLVPLALVFTVTRRAQWLLAGIGFIYFSYFLARVFGNLSGFFSREHAEELLVGPLLTLALVPFLYAAAWASRRDRLSPSRSSRITRDEFGDAWPFTVHDGVLNGHGWGSVTFKANGTEYAINGVAKGQGFKDVEEIWADDPETGMKKNIGPIIDRGLKLCA